jgi:transketolase
MTQRQQFATTMLDIMEQDERVCVLLGDIGVWAFREHMARWPLRCVNVGVSEQAMVGMAAGLACAGLYPVVHTIDSFLVRRAYEFIRLDFGEQGLPGLFVSVGHDRDYAALGPSHWCPEGYEMMERVPGMEVSECYADFRVDYVIKNAVESRKLAYLRLRENP